MKPGSAAVAAITGAAQLTDETIVQRVLAGETPLFEVLMRRHNEQVYRAARAILRDEHEAEDVMQEAYVNAYVHLAQFDGRAKFSTWLTKIAVYEALARAKKRGRWQSLDEMPVEPLRNAMSRTSSENPERQAFGRELGALIESAVDRLGDGYREVFMLRQVQGLSTAETAEALSLSEDVVKTRFSRARSALREDLLEQVGDAAATSAFTFGQSRCDALVAVAMARILTSRQVLDTGGRNKSP
jgi:RNA polymerase sigma-70 factor (ECF subfamily)